MTKDTWNKIEWLRSHWCFHDPWPLGRAVPTDHVPRMEEHRKRAMCDFIIQHQGLIKQIGEELKDVES